MQRRLINEYNDIKACIENGTLPEISFVTREESTWIIDIRGGRVRFDFPLEYPFKPFSMTVVPNSESKYVKLSMLVGFSNDRLSPSGWRSTDRICSLLERVPPIPPVWVDQLFIIDKNSSLLDSMGLQMPALREGVTNELSPLSSGVRFISGIHEDDRQQCHMPLCVDNVIDAAEAHRYIQCAEALGFDNSCHPGYQNEEIDAAELKYRHNDRCVYSANEAEVELLNSRLVPHHPSRIPADWGIVGEVSLFGEWEIAGVNNIWRFYRYKAGDEPVADDADEETCEAQRFPVHQDNVMVKSSSLISGMSVLLYLSDDSLFEGGKTAFYRLSLLQLGISIPTVKVDPHRGTCLSFWHAGRLSLVAPEWMCPFHSGQPLWKVGGPVEDSYKYVLRTDMMYRRVSKGILSLPISPPFSGEKVSALVAFMRKQDHVITTIKREGLSVFTELIDITEESSS